MSINITLTLLNRPYKLKTTPESEGALRNYVKQLNDNVLAYKKSIPGRDDLDYLAMATMNLIAELSEQPSVQNSDEQVQFLKKINSLL